MKHVRTHQQPAKILTTTMPTATFTTCCNLLEYKLQERTKTERILEDGDKDYGEMLSFILYIVC